MNNYTYVACIYIFAFFFPVISIFYNYIGIVNSLIVHNREMAKQAKKMGAVNTKVDQDRKQEVAIAKVKLVLHNSFSS